jgi:hypothetical protein
VLKTVETALRGIIRRHLLADKVLQEVQLDLGYFPGGADPNPQGIIEILKKEKTDWKGLIYGTALQRKKTLAVLKAAYNTIAYEEITDKYWRDESRKHGPTVKTQALLAAVSGSTETALKEVLELQEKLNGYQAKAKAKAKEEEKEKLHKQPRELLKTAARLIGKSEVDLFSSPAWMDIVTKKETLSRPVVMLAQTIVKNMQTLGRMGKDGTLELEITSLSAYAKELGVDKEDIKKGLQVLGGYVYPISYLDNETEEIVITGEQLFKVEFRYSKHTVKKYADVPEEEYKRGTPASYYIANESASRIIVKLNAKMARSLNTKEKLKTLGAVLVTDKYIGSQAGLSDMAAKILNYTASNHPAQGISWVKLYGHLELTNQVKKQGKPRIHKRIEEALEELKALGHLGSYQADQEGIKLVYTGKYVKHPDQARLDKEQEPPKEA